jgi:hypothetical protein
MAMTMVGTQAPRTLFGGIPSQNAQIPGMVTPNITAAMPNYADLEGILNAQNAQKAPSHAAWARSAAANSARQQQQNVGDEQAKMRSAFDEVYGPQLQNAYHDQMVAAEGTTSPMGTYLPKKFGTTTHEPNRWSSNQSPVDLYNKRPGAAPGAVASGGGYYAPYRLGEEQLRGQLDRLWRQSTDPYIRAVSGTTASPADVVRMMHPGGSVGGSNPAAWARMVKGRSGE